MNFAEQTPTILQKIVLDKAKWIEQQKELFPLVEFEQQIQPSDRNFYQALATGTHEKPAFILECKKSSPSKGLIRADFNLSEIAEVYKDYAAVISVLTDQKYFQGDFSYIQQVRNIATQPVLCKDFIIDEYQVYLARYYQADAILLMLSVIDDKTYQKLTALAHQLGMGVLTETSNEAEFERALKLKAKIIGVNNRNLHDLSIDLNLVAKLSTKYASQLADDVRIISESGIYTHQQVKQLAQVCHGFLIGSSLMAKQDLNNAVRAVIFGENKVCGLTKIEDVKKVYQQGALYAGLIFAENSPRQLSLRQAQELVTSAPLRFVGVFQNQSVEFIVKIAHQLSLFAVQLHGHETAEFIEQLRQQLNSNIQIWKAISIDIQAKSAVQIEQISTIDRYLLDAKADNQQGGTGQSFDWSLIPTQLKDRIMLAGGINPDNVKQALQQGCLGLDLNSGVESHKGVKDHKKLQLAFEQIRGY